MKKKVIKAGMNAKLALPKSPTVWIEKIRAGKATVWYIGNDVIQTVVVPVDILEVIHVRRKKK